jgi:DnaJ-class molecular chaperone
MTSSTSYNLNPYHVLQIDDSATFDEVRERHHMLSKTFHPDKQSNNNYDLAKEYFFKIDWAYKALSTPLRRYVYEQFGIQGIEMIEKYPYEFSAYEATIDKIHTQNVHKAITIGSQ